MNAADVLREARALIESPHKWTQGALWRRNGDARAGGAWGQKADCFCADGALFAVTGPPGGAPRGTSLYLTLAAKACGYETASFFNDAATTTHADVLALFDEAIALAEADRLGQ